MKIVSLSQKLLIWVVCIIPVMLSAQSAPVTQAGIVSTADLFAEVPLKVTNFTDIGAISLILQYDDQIALANTVTHNSALSSGSFSYNVSNSGEVIISWYGLSGVNLVDGSELFVINFSRVTAGTTALTWLSFGTSCEYAQYNNGNYTVLNDAPKSSYYLNGSLEFLRRAPGTTLPHFTTCVGSNIEIPVNVTNFVDIGAISLTMGYNPAVLVFNGFTGHPLLPGNFIASASTPGTVVASGYVATGSPGITLTDNSVLFTMNFTYLGGSTNLEWIDNGTSCEYSTATPPVFLPLFDNPQQDFYFNGSVTGFPRPGVMVSGTTTINKGASTDVTFTFTGNAPWELTWSDGANTSVISGIQTSPYIMTVSPADTTTYTATALTDEHCSSLPVDITGNAVISVRFTPLTSLPDLETCVGSTIAVPVTVSNFVEIGAISLTMHYDPAVITFLGFTPHTALPANFVVSATVPGTVVASGYVTNGDPGITLTDNSVLFTMSFTYLGGSTNLEWFDNGTSCEYADALVPQFTPLPDLPRHEFYFDGSISGYTRPTAVVSGTTTINKGASTDVTFTFTGTAPWELTWSDGVTSTVVSGISQSPYLLTAAPLATTTYTAIALSDHHCDALLSDLTGQAVITVRGPIFIKTFLQGAYNTATHTMRTNLNTLNYIPLTQPYATTPLAYSGAESVTGFLGTVVDWVIIELRTGTAASTKVARQAALVLSNGSIVSAEDQTIPPTFSTITPGQAYYVVIYHRNHLPVMSASAITLPNTLATQIDFTTNPTVNIYGGLQGVIQVEPGIYSQVVGDINMDNRLIYSGGSNDRVLIYNNIQNGMLPNPALLNSLVFGYYNGDLNMNGEVRYSGTGNDQVIIYNNIQYFTDPTYSNTIYISPTPVDYTITF